MRTALLAFLFGTVACVQPDEVVDADADVDAADSDALTTRTSAAGATFVQSCTTLYGCPAFQVCKFPTTGTLKQRLTGACTAVKECSPMVSQASLPASLRCASSTCVAAPSWWTAFVDPSGNVITVDDVGYCKP